MGSEKKIIAPGEEKKEEAPKEEIEVAVRYNFKTGNIQIKGVINNEIMCLYLLEKAKDMVKSINKPKASPIAKPKGEIMNFVRGKK